MRHQQNQNKKKQLRNEMKIVASASQFFRNAGFHRFQPAVSQGFLWEIGGGIQSRWSLPRPPIGNRRYSRWTTCATQSNGNIGLENAS